MAPRIRNPKAILAVLSALSLLNYLDRYVLSAVIADVQGDLSLSNFVAGCLPSVFLIGYFATSPVFGILGDRGRQRNALLAGGVAVWSAATVASGLAQSAAWLVGSRAAVGVGEASFGTLAPSIVDEIAPPTRKSSWMSFYSAATPIGSALGYLVGGAVRHAHGWRASFYVAGMPGLVAAGLCLLLDPVRSRAASPERTERGPTPSAETSLAIAGGNTPVGEAARALLSIGLYRSSVLGYCAYTFAIGGFSFWAPKYLHERYGIEAGLASFRFGLLTVAGGVVGTLLGGALADRAVRRERARQVAAGGPSRLAFPDPAIESVATTSERAGDDAIARANARVCAAACAVGAPLALGAICAPSATSFFVLAFPCQIALFILSGPINVTLLRSAPLALRASAMAVCIFAIHAFGDLWSNPLIGLIADHAPMQNAMVTVPVAFLVAAIVWWRGAVASARLT